MNKFYPSDLIGDVLRSLEIDGSDMDREMNLEFHVACDTVADVERLALLLGDRYKNFRKYFDEQEGIWTITINVNMVPNYLDIKQIEEDIEERLSSTKCRYEGFGSFGNAA